MTTELQTKMIVAIAESPFNAVDGGVPESYNDTEVWAVTIISTSQDKGVFTSLLNAHLVYHIPDGEDSLCGLTEQGVVEYQKIKGLV